MADTSREDEDAAEHMVPLSRQAIVLEMRRVNGTQLILRGREAATPDQ